MGVQHIIRFAFFVCCGMSSVLSYWPTRWGYQRAMSPAKSTCWKDTPCYDVVLTYIRDGVTSFDETPGLLKRVFANAGTNRYRAVRFGRDALDFFRAKYGLDFPPITDDQLLDSTSGIMNVDGDAVFKPFVLSTQTRYRVYAATVNEESQFLNLPIDTYGFKILFNGARQSTGTFNQTIPADARAFYGFFTINQCPSSRHGDCRYSILTPKNPREKITIHFKTRAYNIGSLPPTNFFFTDYELYHPVWGQGASRGYFPAHPGVEGGTDGREVLTFPPNRP